MNTYLIINTESSVYCIENSNMTYKDFLSTLCDRCYNKCIEVDFGYGENDIINAGYRDYSEVSINEFLIAY
jgi:hypothetical protein